MLNLSERLIMTRANYFHLCLCRQQTENRKIDFARIENRENYETSKKNGEMLIYY